MQQTTNGHPHVRGKTDASKSAGYRFGHALGNGLMFFIILPAFVSWLAMLVAGTWGHHVSYFELAAAVAVGAFTVRFVRKLWK